MTLVWKRSTDTWAKGENFPLPPICIEQLVGEIQFTFINTNLNYKQCILNSVIGKRIMGNVVKDSVDIDFGLFYTNPLTNEVFFQSFTVDCMTLRATLLYNSFVSYTHIGSSTVNIKLPGFWM